MSAQYTTTSLLNRISDSSGYQTLESVMFMKTFLEWSMLLHTNFPSDECQLLAVMNYALETWHLKSQGLVCRLTFPKDSRQPTQGPIFVAQDAAKGATFYSLRVVPSQSDSDLDTVPLKTFRWRLWKKLFDDDRRDWLDQAQHEELVTIQQL